ncbi:TPA: helix-turn-helix transcriptional regulator [Streptococcus equi subsp. zooepidemicus]|nr:helix-turn-helix transcriptional regulator [Streptococcus equi subsp. zooepidemicus]
MDVTEKLLQLRKSKGMSQEELAEKIGVSRQAISRWENGTALPDASNILVLSKLYDVTADYLLNDAYESDDDLPKVKENKTILHNNLILIAIIIQASLINVFVQPWGGNVENKTFEIIIKLVPLFAASVWMAYNHRYEKDMRQRAKNTRIELLYCICQAVIALAFYFMHRNGWATLLILVIVLIYIFIINPKYMNRRLVRKK